MTPEVRARLDAAEQRVADWFAAHPDERVLTEHPGLVLVGHGPRPNMHGQLVPGSWWVESLAGQRLGFFMELLDGRTHATYFRTSKGDPVVPGTLERLLELCAQDRRARPAAPR